MFGYLAATLATLALVVVLGVVPLPTGPWPGITLGLVAVVAARLEPRLRSGPRGPRVAAWVGALAGGLAAGLGVAAYLGLVLVARSLG
jgi:hypothetical protein